MSVKDWVFATLIAAAATTAVAQPRDKQVATDLALIQLDEPLNGQMARVEGRISGSEADRYTLSNLSIFQPVKVALVADQTPVRLKLGKFDWKEDFGGGSTGSAGRFVKSFTTQGDLLLTVEGPDGAPYSLIVWAGEEKPPNFEPVLVPPSEAGEQRWATPITIGIAAAALAGLAFLFFRRRKGRAA